MTVFGSTCDQRFFGLSRGVNRVNFSGVTWIFGASSLFYVTWRILGGQRSESTVGLLSVDGFQRAVVCRLACPNGFQRKTTLSVGVSEQFPTFRSLLRNRVSRSFGRLASLSAYLTLQVVTNPPKSARKLCFSSN